MKKTLSTFVILVIHFGMLHAQTLSEKPRFLKKPTLLCPIDITKTYSREGLFKGNSETVALKKDSSIVEVAGETTGEKVKIKKYNTDTLLIKGILIEESFAFSVVQQIGNYSIIKFWNLNASKAKSLLQRLRANGNPEEKVLDTLELHQDYSHLKINGLIGSDGNKSFDLSKTYFIVPTRTLINNSTEFENKTGSWNAGILALPIKIRPFATESGQFDFTSGYSIGPTFSWTVHHNWKTNFTHQFLLYVGVSTYTADSTKIKEKREDYKITSFSPALGWMWEKNSIQLSVLMGIDFPSGTLQKQWVYRNRPWFALGLGISLFKLERETSVKKGEN